MGELAQLTRQPTGRVGYHIRELLTDGSIEIADIKQVGSSAQYYYRAVKVPFYTDEEFAAMSPAARQALVGVALQAIMAEALAAFWAGRMIDDPRVRLSWRWFNVDGQGRNDLADDQASSWKRVQEIEAESADRFAISGEPTKSVIVSSLGYVRSRFSSTPPATTLTQLESAPGTATKLGQGARHVEAAVTYAVSHRLRIEILAILNEGECTRHELAALLGVRPDAIKHHLKELLAEGSIDVARSERIGNLLQNYYCAAKIPIYTDEEFAAMPPHTRQAITGVTLQGIVAEALAAFEAGKMIDDRRLWLAWRWFHLDGQGRGDLADEQARSWARAQEIEAESAGRCIATNEPLKSIIVSSLGYVRSRRAPVNGPSDGSDAGLVGGKGSWLANSIGPARR